MALLDQIIMEVEKRMEIGPTKLILQRFGGFLGFHVQISLLYKIITPVEIPTVDVC